MKGPDPGAAHGSSVPGMCFPVVTCPQPSLCREMPCHISSRDRLWHPMHSAGAGGDWWSPLQPPVPFPTSGTSPVPRRGDPKSPRSHPGARVAPGPEELGLGGGDAVSHSLLPPCRFLWLLLLFGCHRGLRSFPESTCDGHHGACPAWGVPLSRRRRGTWGCSPSAASLCSCPLCSSRAPCPALLRSPLFLQPAPALAAPMGSATAPLDPSPVPGEPSIPARTGPLPPYPPPPHSSQSFMLIIPSCGDFAGVLWSPKAVAAAGLLLRSELQGVRRQSVPSQEPRRPFPSKSRSARFVSQPILIFLVSWWLDNFSCHFADGARRISVTLLELGSVPEPEAAETEAGVCPVSQEASGSRTRLHLPVFLIKSSKPIGPC